MVIHEGISFIPGEENGGEWTILQDLKLFAFRDCQEMVLLVFTTLSVEF